MTDRSRLNDPIDLSYEELDRLMRLARKERSAMVHWSIGQIYRVISIGFRNCFAWLRRLTRFATRPLVTAATPPSGTN